MSGVQCQQIKVKKSNGAKQRRTVKAACKVMLERTADRGFVILCSGSPFSSVVAAVQKVVGGVLLYTKGGTEKNEATEADVEEWMRRWRRGEEKRVLIADTFSSRGWEAPAVMVIGKSGTENLVMRTCGFCFLIKLV